MSKLIENDWSDTSVNWLEDDLQTAIVQMLRKEGVEHAADQNAGRRSLRDGQKRKLTGMMAAETDLRIYGPMPKFLMIEVKRKKSGRMSKEQQDRIPKLISLGYDVRVLWADCPADAVAQARRMLQDVGIVQKCTAESE